MKHDLFDLNNRKILITGSTRGLGKIMAFHLAKAGAEVIINGRDKKTTDEVTSELIKKGYKAFSAPFDINGTLPDTLENIEPDIVINNAGIQIRHALEDFPDDEWKKILDTNLTAAFKVTKALIKPMIKRQRGKIINICSLQSELGRKTIAPYAAAKGGLKMLTRAMAVEWAAHNIQINAIGPGYFKTEMTRALYENPDFDSWLCNRTPANRWGNPEELIGPLIFLASEASSYINGQIIYVDGGITASM